MPITGNAAKELRSLGGLMLTEALARNWWLLLLRGVIGVIFGTVALFLPGVTLLSLIFLWGAYAFADGIFSLWAAVTGRVGETTSRWWLAMVGIVDIAAGVFAWVWPAKTALVLLILVAAWAIVTGAMQIWGAIRLRKEIEDEWLLGLTGSLSILLGVVLLLQPAATALSIVWIIGAFAIFMGFSNIGLALRLRKHLHRREEAHKTTEHARQK